MGICIGFCLETTRREWSRPVCVGVWMTYGGEMCPREDGGMESE